MKKEKKRFMLVMINHMLQLFVSIGTLPRVLHMKNKELIPGI
jgi:hypothetical protein